MLTVVDLDCHLARRPSSSPVPDGGAHRIRAAPAPRRLVPVLLRFTHLPISYCSFLSAARRRLIDQCPEGPDLLYGIHELVNRLDNIGRGRKNEGAADRRGFPQTIRASIKPVGSVRLAASSSQGPG